MIREGSFEKNGTVFDRRMEPSDWRFSATIVGLIRYFKYNHLSHETEGRFLYYNFNDVNLSQLSIEVLYLRFVEQRFLKLMHHVKVREILSEDSANEVDLKELKDRLNGNVVMKKFFKDFKEPLKEKEDILAMIEENFAEIIRETFKNAIPGYRKFANMALYGKDSQQRCRLWGFYVDTGRKTKSLGFNFDKAAATVTDYLEFDYIPFAFSHGRESVFVNNNISVECLLKANNDIDRYLSNIEDGDRRLWNNIFYQMGEGSAFISQDVEIILKRVEEDSYHTIMLRQTAIDIFRRLRENNRNGTQDTGLDKLLRVIVKVTDDYYINYSQVITNAIINGIFLDDMIEQLFKLDNVRNDGSISGFRQEQLIRINVEMYRCLKKMEGNMDTNKYLSGAYAAAQEVKAYFLGKKLENKMRGYRQKLTSSIVAKDYDRFIEVMLQLSSYTEIAFPFLHELIKDFEENKNLAYEFINNLNNVEKVKKEDK